MQWASMIFALTSGALGAATLHADEAASQPTSPSNSLAPSVEILRVFRSDDPEEHLAGFAAWYAWRGSLEFQQRRAADRFLGREEWLSVLADEVMYDMESRSRRLAAYKLLKRIGGQRVFPYFLWGMGDRKDLSPPQGGNLFQLAIVASLRRLSNQSAYVMSFFKRYGDPTVIEFLPEEYEWMAAIERIQRRWSNKDSPHRDWEPLTVDSFVTALSDEEARKRRLAIRALTTNRRCGGIAAENRFRSILKDPDDSVRTVAAKALAVTPCPSARGMLKRIAEDQTVTIELRSACLYAIAKCGTARQWTAEWMLENVVEWPEAMDPTVRDCLSQLRPSAPAERKRYEVMLERLCRRLNDDRVRRIIDSAFANTSE